MNIVMTILRLLGMILLSCYDFTCLSYDKYILYVCLNEEKRKSITQLVFLYFYLYKNGAYSRVVLGFKGSAYSWEALMRGDIVLLLI